MRKWWKDSEQKKIVSNKIRNTLLKTKNNTKLGDYKKVFKNKYLLDRDTKCLLFKGALDKYGFGRIRYNNKTHGVHRLAYELKYGEIKDRELFITHTCNNYNCINTDHLIIMDYIQIMFYRMKKNRGLISKLSEEQKYEIKRLYIEDGIPRAELRKRFNTSMGVINFIIDNLYKDFKINID